MATLFQNLSKTQRMILFYGVCIWVRLLLILLLWRYWSNLWIRVLFLIFLVLSCWRLYTTLDENVWWSKKIHLLTCIISIILVMSMQTSLKQFVIFILLLDLGFGIISSIYKRFGE